MKKGLILILAVTMLLGLLAPASAAPFSSNDQIVNFSAGGGYFWAMIWHYTHAWRESATPGAVNYDYWLGYDLGNFYGEVHVAYLYNWAMGQYVEALALRDVEL